MIINEPAIARARAGQSDEGSPRRAWPLGLMLGATLALATAALLASPASSLANHEQLACTTNQQQGKLCLIVSDTPDPVSYSGFDGNSTFIEYVAEVTNDSRSSSLSHVILNETLPEGTSFVRVTTSRGTCSNAPGTVDCTFGTLKKGQSATVEVVVTAPETAEAEPPDRIIRNVVTASFDERFNDQDGGKDDTVVYPDLDDPDLHGEPTTVSKTAGQTFVPRGHDGKVDTDPDELQYGNASIPNASTDVVATINVDPPDAFCILGRVTIGSRNFVCRAGGFVDALVVEADTGDIYDGCPGGAAPCNPLVFHLRWDAPLTSSRQNARNMVAFYQAEASPIEETEVFDARCNAAASNTPCLKNILKEADGGWSFDLVKPDNGRMR